jgi:hypothetical protein
MVHVGDKPSSRRISAIKADTKLLQQVKDGYSTDEYFMKIIETLKNMQNDKLISPHLKN